MNFSDFLLSKVNELSAINTEHLKNNINEYDFKIDNFVKTNSDLGITKKDVIDKINDNDPYVIASIRKSPAKQNVSEKAFFEYLNIDKAPAGGKKSIRFDADGNFSNDKKNSTKSADFILEDAYGNMVYGTQKYLKEAGGAQDNQIEDAKLFANFCSKKHKAIIAVDGDYGTSILKNMPFNDNVEVLTADEILVKLNNEELKKHTALHD